MSVGSVLGTCVIERLENFVSLPKAPVNSERGLENNLSLSSSIDLSLSSSFSLRAEDSYSVWQQWRKNRRVCCVNILSFYLTVSVCIYAWLSHITTMMLL